MWRVAQQTATGERCPTTHAIIKRMKWKQEVEEDARIITNKLLTHR
jgi:hypothetical protein